MAAAPMCASGSRKSPGCRIRSSIVRGTADAATLGAAGVVLGNTYPNPIVDHAFARQRALDAFKAPRARASEAET